MESPGLKDLYSRQTILPGVGLAGQKKWETASVFLAGEGSALDAAQTALERVGLSQIHLLDSNHSSSFPTSSFALILTADAGWRRRLNRQIRLSSTVGLFAWAGVSGYSLYLKGHDRGFCPCLECFEVMNPKAFYSAEGEKPGTEESVFRVMGAMAATEMLQWILTGESSLAGKVWMISFNEGLSVQHEVAASPKCPAALSAQGAVTNP